MMTATLPSVVSQSKPNPLTNQTGRRNSRLRTLFWLLLVFWLLRLTTVQTFGCWSTTTQNRDGPICIWRRGSSSCPPSYLELFQWSGTRCTTRGTYVMSTSMPGPCICLGSYFRFSSWGVCGGKNDKVCFHFELTAISHHSSNLTFGLNVLVYCSKCSRTFTNPSSNLITFNHC